MRIGSGWKKKDKNGEPYLSIVISIPFLGDMNMALYPVKDKTKDSQPDYKVEWFPPRPEGQKMYTDNNEVPF